MKTRMVMPTWKNETMCGEAIRTLYDYTDFAQHGELIVIDNAPNGTHLANICAKYGARYRPQTENLGWMRSINSAWDHECTTPLFTMCNDDVVFPQDREFWPRTFKLFEDDEEVGGVGPISNYVMGAQYFQLQLPGQVGEVKYLIGFCATYRANTFWSLGGLDSTLPGGDDLDFALRIAKETPDKKLLCDRRSFLYHYGSVTGNRVHNDWDSHQAQLKTANALIAKHGLAQWYACVSGGWKVYLEAEDSQVSPETMQRIGAKLTALNQHLANHDVAAHEGSSTVKQIEYLVARTRGWKRVAEIGFNAGVSALTMLEANPALELISFDLGKWPTVGISGAYLKAQYGDRFKLILGDSQETLPAFYPGMAPFDFVFVDGGHDYDVAFSDLVNVAPHSKIVVIDDLNMPGVRKAWNQAVAAGIVKQTGIYVDNSPGVARQWAEGEGQQ